MTGDIESVKTAIAAALNGTGFTDALAAVNVDKNDGYTTPGPAVGYPYERAVLEAYPAFELVGLATGYGEDEDLKKATHQIAVLWTVAGDNEATLTTDVERLVRATRDLLWRSVLGGQVGLAPMLVVSDDYSPLAPGNGHPFMKGGRVIVSATTLT